MEHENDSDDHIPPNEKEWTESDREMIHDRLPGYMTLGDTRDIRVGKWVPIEVGGSIRIENIPDEVEAIEETFESLGVEVRIPLVKVHQEGHPYTAMQAYSVEIENWEARGTDE